MLKYSKITVCNYFVFQFRYKFPVLYINQYYPRPGTPAAKMKRVPTRDVKQRTKQLTDLFHSYEPYRKRIGQKYQVLVTELAYDKQHYVGHNEFYEQVLLIFDILSLKNRSKINDRVFLDQFLSRLDFVLFCLKIDVKSKELL